MSKFKVGDRVLVLPHDSQFTGKYAGETATVEVVTAVNCQVQFSDGDSWWIDYPNIRAAPAEPEWVDMPTLPAVDGLFEVKWARCGILSGFPVSYSRLRDGIWHSPYSTLAHAAAHSSVPMLGENVVTHWRPVAAQPPQDPQPQPTRVVRAQPKQPEPDYICASDRAGIAALPCLPPPTPATPLLVRLPLPSEGLDTLASSDRRFVWGARE